jgi:DMSO/TMAO reductase YedYZ molybdopterin-dependent catalytic subunit
MRIQIFIALLILAIFLGCTAQSDNIRQLQSVEVKEYQGEDLSSVADFRENSIKGVQDVDAADYILKISGLVNTPKSYTYDEVLAHQKYSKVVTLNCVEGWSTKILWEGVLVKDLLAEISVKPEANTIIFYAADGYSTSFPLSYVTDNDIILAYRMNNVTLPTERGYPFQLVAEDKWGYKWIKWITGIELSNNTNYKGTWESAGYSATGNLDEPKFQ